MALRELEDGIRQLQLRLAQQQAQMQQADPIGRIEAFGGSTAPAGWLMCNGAAVSRTLYPRLFAVYGTTYGAGNGSTTFTLPNASGRVLVGRDASQIEFNQLGETGGAKTHTHPLSNNGHAKIWMFNTSSNVRAILTPISPQWSPNHSVNVGASSTANANVGHAVELGGSTDAATTLPPYLVINYITRAG